MGLSSCLKNLRGKRVTLDTMIFIYAFEAHPIYLSFVKPLFSEVEKGKIKAVTSTITLTECLVQPFRIKDMELVAHYKNLFHNLPHLSVIPVTEEIAEKAAWLRAQYQLKTPDAIQLATAFVSDSHVFLTNDEGLLTVKGIQVLVLDQLLR